MLCLHIRDQLYHRNFIFLLKAKTFINNIVITFKNAAIYNSNTYIGYNIVFTFVKIMYVCQILHALFLRATCQ